VANARGKFDDFMNQNPTAATAAKGAATTQASPADRDALFKQFQSWQADQTAKENARAQVRQPKPQ
jgi:hypothetical protein